MVEVFERTASWYRARMVLIQKWRERVPSRMETLGSRRRSMVSQIVRYSELSVLRGEILSIDWGRVFEVQVPLGLTCKNKLGSYPAFTTV
jgi:hypothetical protein